METTSVKGGMRDTKRWTKTEREHNTVRDFRNTELHSVLLVRITNLNSSVDVGAQSTQIVVSLSQCHFQIGNGTSWWPFIIGLVLFCQKTTRNSNKQTKRTRQHSHYYNLNRKTATLATYMWILALHSFLGRLLTKIADPGCRDVSLMMQEHVLLWFCWISVQCLNLRIKVSSWLTDLGSGWVLYLWVSPGVVLTSDGSLSVTVSNYSRVSTKLSGSVHFGSTLGRLVSIVKSCGLYQ